MMLSPEDQQLLLKITGGATIPGEKSLLDRLDREINESIRKVHHHHTVVDTTVIDAADDDDIPDSASAMLAEALAELDFEHQYEQDQERVPIEAEMKLRETLASIATVQKLIEMYTTDLKELRSKLAALKRESLSLAEQHAVGDITLPELRCKFVFRDYERRENPFVRKKLPTNLARYFEDEERLEPEVAMKRAEAIVEWIAEHLATTTPAQSLLCKKMRGPPKGSRARPPKKKT